MSYYKSKWYGKMLLKIISPFSKLLYLYLCNLKYFPGFYFLFTVINTYIPTIFLVRTFVIRIMPLNMNKNLIFHRFFVVNNLGSNKVNHIYLN